MAQASHDALSSPTLVATTPTTLTLAYGGINTMAQHRVAGVTRSGLMNGITEIRHIQDNLQATFSRTHTLTDLQSLNYLIAIATSAGKNMQRSL